MIWTLPDVVAVADRRSILVSRESPDPIPVALVRIAVPVPPPMVMLAVAPFVSVMLPPVEVSVSVLLLASVIESRVMEPPRTVRLNASPLKSMSSMSVAPVPAFRPMVTEVDVDRFVRSVSETLKPPPRRRCRWHRRGSSAAGRRSRPS